MNGLNVGTKLLYSDELDEIKKLRETLVDSNVNPSTFLRTIPLSHMIKDMETGSLRSEIPGLAAVFPQIKETLNISASLAQLKVADRVLEGADQAAFWKDIWHIETMDTPKLTLPKMDADDQMNSLEDFKGTDGTEAKDAGGDIGVVEFDTTDDKGYYRIKTAVKRNWIRDNNFRALEVYLKQHGERWYNRVGSFLFAKHVAAVTGNQTDTRANLDGSSSTRLEGLLNVLEDKLPNDGYAGTRVLMNPTDMFQMKVEQWGTGGPIPLVSGAYYDKDRRNVSEPGLAALLNVDGVFKARWVTAGTVLVWNAEKGYQVGLRQDIEFEDYGDTLKGLVGSATSMRLDSADGHAKANWKVTAFATP